MIQSGRAKTAIARGRNLVLLILFSLLDMGCSFQETHTQEFQIGENDLQGLRLHFIPTPGIDVYQRRVVETTELGNDPANDTVVDFSNGPVEVSLGANAVYFYGSLYDTIYIGSDGTIGMGEPGDNASLATHFMRPQVSLVPIDPNGTRTGVVSYDIVDGDSVAVTYQDVIVGRAYATAQAEFFIRQAEYGDIVLTYPRLSANAAGVIGLSAGYSDVEIENIIDTFGFHSPLSAEVMTGTVTPSG